MQSTPHYTAELVQMDSSLQSASVLGFARAGILIRAYEKSDGKDLVFLATPRGIFEVPLIAEHMPPHVTSSGEIEGFGRANGDTKIGYYRYVNGEWIKVSPGDAWYCDRVEFGSHGESAVTLKRVPNGSLIAIVTEGGKKFELNKILGATSCSVAAISGDGWYFVGADARSLWWKPGEPSMPFEWPMDNLSWNPIQGKRFIASQYRVKAGDNPALALSYIVDQSGTPSTITGPESEPLRWLHANPRGDIFGVWIYRDSAKHGQQLHNIYQFAAICIGSQSWLLDDLVVNKDALQRAGQFGGHFRKVEAIADDGRIAVVDDFVGRFYVLHPAP